MHSASSSANSNSEATVQLLVQCLHQRVTQFNSLQLSPSTPRRLADLISHLGPLDKGKKHYKGANLRKVCSKFGVDLPEWK